jgi:hypothetical protein
VAEAGRGGSNSSCLTPHKQGEGEKSVIRHEEEVTTKKIEFGKQELYVVVEKEVTM